MRAIIDTGTYGEYLHYGMPLSLITVLGKDGRINVSTNASITPLPGSTPRLVIGILKDNWTHKLISESGEFVVNLLTPEMRGVAVQCGSHSGENVDKLALCQLTALPGKLVRAPLIEECPLNIECRVLSVEPLDDLDLFVAEILAVEADERWSNGRGGINLARYDPLFYAFGFTFARGGMIGLGGL